MAWQRRLGHSPGGPRDDDFEDLPNYGVPRLVQDLLTLRSSDALSDVVFVCGVDETHVQVHSSIVIARCPALVGRVSAFVREHPGNLARTDQIPDARLILRYPQTPACAMDMLTTYMYSGRVRLGSKWLPCLFQTAMELGMSRLAHIILSHINSTLSGRRAARLLRESLEFDVSPVRDAVLRYISDNTAVVLESEEFLDLPRCCVMEITKLEDVNIEEEDLWHAVVKWAGHRVALGLEKDDFDDGKDKDGNVRIDKFTSLLRLFVRPGCVRLLSMSSDYFHREVHQLGVLSDEEVLLKYRYDAIAAQTRFEDYFPWDRVEFISRIRQRSMVFESSSHPHPRGISETTAVSLPAWTSKVLISFDSRTSLGKYADLSFYENSSCTRRIASLDSILQAYRIAQRRESSEFREPTLCFSLKRNRSDWQTIFFTFYATDSFSAEWGYFFRVRPLVA